MPRTVLTPEMLTLVAERFKALGEPARLQLLNCLRSGAMTVNELVDRTGLGQANASRHLQLLHASGFVTRRKEGLFTFYALADANVFRLCDIMCGRVQAQVETRRRRLAI